MDTLQLLDKVHGFYTDSFTLLMTLTVTILVIIGGIMPFILQAIQARNFRSEKESLESRIKVEIQNAKIEMQSDLDQNFAVEKSTIRDLLKNESLLIKQLMEEQNAVLEGGIFFVQASIFCRENNFAMAGSDFAQAADLCFKGNNELNGQRALRRFIKECLPKLQSSDFDNIPTLQEAVNRLLERLKGKNKNSRFSDDILIINMGMIDAKKRKNENDD